MNLVSFQLRLRILRTFRPRHAQYLQESHLRKVGQRCQRSTEEAEDILTHQQSISIKSAQYVVYLDLSAVTLCDTGV